MNRSDVEVGVVADMVKKKSGADVTACP